MDFSHKPVLLLEVIGGLNIRQNGIYVDCTAGGGGHSEAILKQLTSGQLISIDDDPDAIVEIKKKFSDHINSVIIKGNFGNVKSLLDIRGIQSVDGILMDIGVSSYQLDNPERGFSFHNEAYLDMRMSKSGSSAADLINNSSFETLKGIIGKYGEEKYCGSIARAIVAERSKKPIQTTLQLAEIIKESVPQRVRRAEHPARKTFQAIRIAVNEELKMLEQGLDQAFEVLASGGRIAVISFHSLEDRIVKKKMIGWCSGCICPPDFPVCVCGLKPKARLITRKPVTASDRELKDNIRSRSAKLRICEKIN